jgi:branched-chain amino acid transport system substrate-binding protein
MELYLIDEIRRVVKLSALTLIINRYVLWLAMALLVYACKKSDPDPVPAGTEVRMGAILDLSGDYSEEGLNGKAAIELALTDLNAIHQKAGSGIRFTVSYTDTHLDTALTLQAAKNFYNQGIRWLVAGPNNSAGLNAIKSYVDQQQMVSLGCFSSSPALSVTGDNIYRLITDDNVQGKALIRMMLHDSLKALVVVWRDDTYGNGLYHVVKEQLTATGATVYDGVHYNPANTDFTGMIQQLSGVVAEAIAVHGAENTGVLIISYQETAGFLHAAGVRKSELASVKWYGCDANAQKSSVTSDSVAAGFASGVRFVAPIMAIGTAEGLPAPAQSLSSRIIGITGSAPDAYALSAYDAVMIFGQCYNLLRKTEAQAVKSVLPNICAAYNALGIQRTLNEAGDLATANYIFWTVDPLPGGYSWESYATWVASEDRIIAKP